MDKREYSRRFHEGGVTNKTLREHPFLFLQEHKNDYTTLAKQSVRGLDQPNLLNQTFFSKANMDIIQHRLQKYVFWETWKQTNIHYKIKSQDETQLIIAMKYVYETYAKHLPYKIKEQIDELDDFVVKEAGPVITSEVLAHVGYLEHINNPITPPDRPKNLSSKGTKLLPSITTIFENQKRSDRPV
jgi:hypothetical protein